MACGRLKENFMFLLIYSKKAPDILCMHNANVCIQYDLLLEKDYKLCMLWCSTSSLQRGREGI